MTAPEDNKVDEDFGKEDPLRTYPEDSDKVFAWIKDVQEHIEKKFPSSETKFGVKVDCIAMQFDNLMSVLNDDLSKAV